MKTCVPCGRDEENHDLHTCPACGEASWSSRAPKGDAVDGDPEVTEAEPVDSDAAPKKRGRPSRAPKGDAS
jgi:hypothetical protein